MQLDLNVFADSLRIYPLSTLGREGILAPFTQRPTSNNHFTIGLDQNIQRTLWFGVEKYGNGVAVGVEDVEAAPQEFSLQQNYPNPFNPITNISFSIPSRGFVSLKVFDVIGREVSTLVAEELSAGNYSRQWNAETAASGVYFYRLNASGYVQTRRLVVLK
jgi:hypothetical protein